jgi:hypothetical protein
VNIDEVQLLSKLGAALKSATREFGTHPYDFLSESDVKCLMQEHLRREFEPIRIEGRPKGWSNNAHINPVKTEYAYEWPDGTGDRYDVAILDSVSNDIKWIWNQRVRVGIELKLWQLLGKREDPTADLTRLRGVAQERSSSAPFTGLAMVFVHPDAQDSLGGWSLSSTPAIPVRGGAALHFVTQGGNNWKGSDV